MFKSSFWPYMALLMLHFLLYPVELCILAQIVLFLRLCIAHMTLTLKHMKRYFNTLSKAANIISLAFILRQLLGVKQSRPTVKCNIEKNIITYYHIKCSLEVVQIKWILIMALYLSNTCLCHIILSIVM